jgi:hypothetical protein
MILRQEFFVDVAAVEERPSMPSLAKLKNTRKRHFYYRRHQRQEEVAPLHALYRAEGRIAALGWARCSNCGHKECWVSGPWLNDDVVCSCGGYLAVSMRGLDSKDAAWRDRRGVIHSVEIDQLGNTITTCRHPMDHELRTLEAFVGNAAPSCVWCVSALTKAA